MPDDSASKSTDRQPTGPDRGQQSREPRPAPVVLGRARLRYGQAKYYPLLRPDSWYAVIDRNREASEPIAREGYVWLEVDGRPQHVWAAHFELQVDPP